MKKIVIDLENCYGIKKITYEFDFSNHKAFAIYAPNGVMKTSLAHTFKDISTGLETKDRIFPSRTCIRKVTDEQNNELSRASICIIRPFDEYFGQSEKTSTLLVDNVLRREYEELHIEIDRSKEKFLNAMKEQSGSKRNIEIEISSTFMESEDEFYQAILSVKNDVVNMNDALFSYVDYDKIFDDKVLSFLNNNDVQTAIESYIKKYNELLASSTYFKKGIFTYYHASNVAKSLGDNGFFDAKHTIILNANKQLEITDKKQLEELISKEKEGISNDRELRKRYAEIEKLITRNVNVRGFVAYIEEHEEILSNLIPIDQFKKEVWKSYFKERFDLFKDLVDKYSIAEKRKKQIEQEADRQRTQWEYVIEIFNNRFFVPFTLVATNKVPVILGQEPILSLGFIFKDEIEEVSVEKDTLLQTLSTGEKNAFYILNIIFEVEVRKKARQETIFIIDDIADSFDYKNKYAIIQYLMDIDKEPYFNQIILTHNFDFFRTLSSRFVKYSNCLLALKCENRIVLKRATGIKNVFINDWKVNFFSDHKKKVASIPFIRNILEYTKGNQDPDYLKLTSLLHWKNDTNLIKICDLDDIYNSLFCDSGTSPDHNRQVMDLIITEAENCLSEGEGINFENKIILSIAIRLLAEKYMVEEINDAVFVNNIGPNQTIKLFDKYKERYLDKTDQIETIQRVILMTPENIHLNSFMYEPIMDISDEHLRQLFSDVQNLERN